MGGVRRVQADPLTAATAIQRVGNHCLGSVSSAAGPHNTRCDMKFTLNGQVTEYNGDPELDLMTFLREAAGIVSPKNGCAPQAACGCCAVQLNGKAVLSCVTKMGKVDDGAVTTTEGLGTYRQNVYANAFVQCGGVQCGFCIPGIVMQSDALINKNPEPTRADVEKGVDTAFVPLYRVQEDCGCGDVIGRNHPQRRRTTCAHR